VVPEKKIMVLIPTQKMCCEGKYWVLDKELKWRQKGLGREFKWPEKQPNKEFKLKTIGLTSPATFNTKLVNCEGVSLTKTSESL